MGSAGPVSWLHGEEKRRDLTCTVRVELELDLDKAERAADTIKVTTCHLANIFLLFFLLVAKKLKG